MAKGTAHPGAMAQQLPGLVSCAKGTEEGNGMACSECGKARGHMSGCPKAEGGGAPAKRRSRAKGAPKSPPGTVIIASHTSNWHLVNEARQGDLWYSAWTCTVCSRPKYWRSRRQNDRPGNEWHEATKAKLQRSRTQLPKDQEGNCQKGEKKMKKIQVTAFEAFWYVMGNLCFGASYLAKVPVKRALVDYGLVPQLTGAEQFWYVTGNICFGASYLAKVIISKALSELPQFSAARAARTVTGQVQPWGTPLP